MTIYDLEKQTSRDPLHVAYDDDTPEDRSLGVFLDNGFGTVAHVGPCGPADAEDEANAQFLAHCHNNFMAALRGLQQAQRELDLLYAHAINTGLAEAGDPPHRQIARLIAELEEVK